jgi:hypothetical protein
MKLNFVECIMAVSSISSCLVPNIYVLFISRATICYHSN